MISKSKFKADEKAIIKLFFKAGISGAENILPLGAGEYNSVYSVDANDKAYAIKIAPVDDSCSLIYEKEMMNSEVYFYSLMKEAGIRVPEIYYSDFSLEEIPAAYFIMERLEGTQIDKAELSLKEKEISDKKTAQMVAKMHSIKGEKFGYIQNGLFENWYLALLNMVENLIKDAKRFNKNSARGTKLLEYIKLNRSVLEKVECRLINFDIWPPNIFCKKTEKDLELAWIDPERCLWGDRIADFVCLEFSKLSLEKKLKSIEAYNQISDEPIIISDALRIRFFVMVGYLGLIMETEKYARYTPMNFGWWRNVIASKILFSSCFKNLKILTEK